MNETNIYYNNTLNDNYTYFVYGIRDHKYEYIHLLKNVYLKYNLKSFKKKSCS